MLKLLLASIIATLTLQSETPIYIPQETSSEKNVNIIINDIFEKRSDDMSLITVAPQPKRNINYIAPILKAHAAIGIDDASATILFEKNARTPMPIASITKVMTAIIILEEHNLNEVVTVGYNPPRTTGSIIWLAEGEKMTVKNLLYGLLIPSGNDAAIALAEYNAKSETAFINKMNEKAKLLGLTQTLFVNATGLDGAKNNVSTAYEVGLLTMYALKHALIQETVKIPYLEIYGENGSKHILENTNKLLGKELNIIGLKTGKTADAGPSFVSLSKTPAETYLITVVLNSEQRFTDTNTLVSWVKHSYIW